MVLDERDRQIFLIIITGHFMSHTLSMKWSWNSHWLIKVHLWTPWLIEVWGVGIPWSRIAEQLIEVSGFEGNASFALGYINFDLTNGPIREATRSHVLDARSLYHLLLGGPRSISTRLRPPCTIGVPSPSGRVRMLALILLSVYSREMKPTS